MESNGKGFRQAVNVCRNPFSFDTVVSWVLYRKETKMKKTQQKKTRKAVIATRKTCKAASGTGLSHYILMDRKGN